MDRERLTAPRARDPFEGARRTQGREIAAFGLAGTRGTAEADARVMTELYLRHGAALMAFALCLVDDRGRAEDVVQETMLRGWRNLDRIDPSRGDPRAYLFAPQPRDRSVAHRRTPPTARRRR